MNAFTQFVQLILSVNGFAFLRIVIENEHSECFISKKQATSLFVTIFPTQTPVSQSFELRIDITESKKWMEENYQSFCWREIATKNIRLESYDCSGKWNNFNFRVFLIGLSHRSISSFQFMTVLFGQMTNTLSVFNCGWEITVCNKVMSWSVFPRPMQCARIHPEPGYFSKLSMLP